MPINKTPLSRICAWHCWCFRCEPCGWYTQTHTLRANERTFACHLRGPLWWLTSVPIAAAKPQGGGTCNRHRARNLFLPFYSCTATGETDFLSSSARALPGKFVATNIISCRHLAAAGFCWLVRRFSCCLSCQQCPQAWLSTNTFE